VTTDAITRHVGVVVIGRQPRSSRMAIVTIIAARNMRRVLAGGGIAIVAGSATTQHLRVIDRERWYPYSWVVAVLADVGGQGVGRVFARGRNAVVAVDTAAGDIGVVEVSR
jgi:hypothetical protein